MYRKTELANGITVLTESISSLRSVSVGLWLKRGSRHESEELNGIYHFIEHMVFKGTKNRTAKEIAFAMDAIGGQFDALTSKEYTAFYFRVLDEHLSTAVDILSDIVLNPTFRKEHLDMERKVIAEEIKMVEDNPEDVVHRLFSKNFYKNHPLGRPIAGTCSNLENIDEKILSSYFRENYVPENIVISLAGKVDHDNAVEMLSEHFLGLGGNGQGHDAVVPVETPSIDIVSKEGLEQAQLVLGCKCYSQNHPKRFVLHVMNTILGGTMSSRLFQKIREEQGLAYSVHSFSNSYSDSGYQAVYAGMSHKAVKKVITLILAEYKDMKKGNISAEEFENAKNNLKGSLMLSFESSSQRMTRLALQHCYFGAYDSLDDIVKKIDAVTREQVIETACELFKEEELSLVVLGGKELENMTIERKELSL